MQSPDNLAFVMEVNDVVPCIARPGKLVSARPSRERRERYEESDPAANKKPRHSLEPGVFVWCMAWR